MKQSGLKITESLNIHRLFSVFIISYMFLLHPGCDSPEISDYEEFFKFNDEEKGIIPFSNIKGIDIENSRGGVIIYGSTRTDTLSYILSKTIRAKTNEIALNHFDDIDLHFETETDTLRLSVLYPFDTDYLTPSGYIDLYIPYQMPLAIRSMNEGIYIYYMANDIIVRKVKDHIDIRNHSGSCDIQSEKGDIQIEIALPDSGYCIAKTENGDIKLTIPHETSANIYAKTYSGIINTPNLDILNLIQNNSTLSGTLGTGEGEIFLETRAGNIFIEVLDFH